jgi:hypothetical protein
MTSTSPSTLLTQILYDLIKRTMPADRLTAYLPFNTVLRRGDNHVHIVNDSVYTVDTQHHTIFEGMSLCARHRRFTKPLRIEDEATCPGCTSLAKGIIARSLGL